MKKRMIIPAVLVALIIACAVIQPVTAYFTAYTAAQGKVTISLGPRTRIEEPKVKDWTKHIVITNSGKDGEPSNVDCYVRARAFSGGEQTLTYEGKGWTDGGDGWWYYDTILAPGEATQELLVKISGIPEDTEEGDSFNVAVVYESVQAVYDAQGKPQAADWTMKPVTVTEGGQG